MNNILNKTRKSKNSLGFSLIEMLVYVALVGIVTVFIHGIILSIYCNNKRIINLTKINSNAYSMMERVRYEIENSSYVYLPTSNMANYNYNSAEADQLSLATKIDALPHDDVTFIDFYLEDGVIFFKKEELAPVALTSSDVSVSDLSFSYYENSRRESVTVDLAIESKDSSIPNSSIHLISTIALRSF